MIRITPQHTHTHTHFQLSNKMQIINVDVTNKNWTTSHNSQPSNCRFLSFIYSHLLSISRTISNRRQTANSKQNGTVNIRRSVDHFCQQCRLRPNNRRSYYSHTTRRIENRKTRSIEQIRRTRNNFSVGDSRSAKSNRHVRHFLWRFDIGWNVTNGNSRSMTIVT